MPRIYLRVPDTQATVTRPVVMEVIRDVLKATNLSADTKILFPGTGEQGYQPDTTLSAINEEREKNLFTHEKRVFIEVDEDYDEDGAITAAVMKPENLFIFVDSELDCYVKPVYSNIETSVTIRYRAKDRVEALRWRDAVRSRISMGRSQLLHSVTYSYIIPQSTLAMLYEIHRLRENVMGYGESFQEYKDKYFTKRKTIVTTQAGTEPLEVVTETQRRVIGSFDFNTRPERAERDGNGDAWTIAFTYRFTYSRPVGVVVHHPLVVHNQLLSSKYRVDAPTDRDDFHQLSHTMTTDGLRYFEPDYMLDKWKANRGLCLPDFDDFIPSQILPNTLRVLTGMVTIDMDNPELLMNFNELGDWTFEDDIKEFLQGEAPFVTRHYMSVFNLTFYRNRDMMDQSLNMIRMDPNLDVILQEPVSLRNYFHVRLGLYTELEALHPEAIIRLRRNSCVFKKILKVIYPWLDVDKFLSRLGWCGPVTDDEWNNIIRETTPYPQRADPSNRIGFNTVQGFFVRTKYADQES